MIAVTNVTLGVVTLDVDLRAVREGEAARGRAGHTYVRIRVRFPDGRTGYAHVVLREVNGQTRLRVCAVNPLADTSQEVAVHPWTEDPDADHVFDPIAPEVNRD